MSAPSTTVPSVRVSYGAHEVATNPRVTDFIFEAAVPVVDLEGNLLSILIRSTWNGIEEISGHIARLTSELDHANARVVAAERVAHDADEIARSLSIGQFPCSGLVPVGEADGSENVWVRIRSTANGIERICARIARLDERAREAEAALDRSEADARRFGRDEFEWQDSIPVDELNGDRVLVRVLGTEVGIAKIKARLEQLGFFNELLNRSLAAFTDRAEEAEAKLAALEAEKAETLASVAGFEVLPADATTYTVSYGDATMTVTGSPSGVANVVKLAYGGFEYGVSA